VSARGGS
jgi:hypothetical protein